MQQMNEINLSKVIEITNKNYTAYDLKGVYYSDNFVLNKCVEFIERRLIFGGLFVLFVWFMTPMIKLLCLKLSIENPSKKELFNDIANSIYIIDYMTAGSYIIWIIAVYMYNVGL